MPLFVAIVFSSSIYTNLSASLLFLSYLSLINLTVRLPIQSYISEVYIADLVTLRWRQVQVAAERSTATTPTATLPKGGVPAGRYLAGSVFIPLTTQRKRPGRYYRELYDRPIPSTHTNYAGSNSDSVLIFGGHNGATGSFPGGEGGGMLNELWMLRLTNFSTTGTVTEQDQYRQQHCAWRYKVGNRTSGIAQGTRSCMSTSTSSSGSVASCELRDVLLLAWCSDERHTLSQTLR